MWTMCGLLTFVSATGNAAAMRDAVADALESLHHRGPDETGVTVIDDDVVFARDPYGIKPFFHLVTDDGVYFASEKKALLPFAASAQAGDAGVDGANLSHYLTLQYVPEPGTLQRGIGRIGSGESFVYTPGGPLATRRYYQPQFRPTPTADPESLYSQIRETLRESVRVHMRSDVPVGAFLSSGIDSTAVVALAREFNPNILTFTVGFDVAGHPDGEVAHDSARHRGATTIPTR